MNRFLNDALSLEGSSQVEKAAYLLKGATLDKSSLGNLATKLSSTSMFGNAIFTLLKQNSIASGVTLANIFSEVYSRLENLFATSGAVSLLMQNTSEIMSQEIKKLEEELFSLEKNINNYGFLLSDGNSYDSVFFESFSNELNTEVIDFSSVRLTDRSGIDFASNEIATVEKFEGVLTLPSATNKEYPLSATVFASNCAGFLTNPISTNSVSNTTNYLKQNGWRPVIESPIIIDSSIYLFNNLYSGTGSYTGAQFVLQYQMDDENPIDTIVIEPLSNYSFDLIQVVGFINDLDEIGEELMVKPVKIERTFNLFFPKKSFKKFHIYLNQKAYTREASNKNYTESTAEQRMVYIDKLNSELYDHSYEIEIGKGYPIINLTPYWINVLQNLGSSLSREDLEALKQGLPSYWSYKGGLMQKQVGVFQDDDGAFFNREKHVNATNVNHSYIQSLVGRFFGNQNSSIGSFFKTLISNYYYPNSPMTVSAIDTNESQVRSAPFPRIGEEDIETTETIEESDSYTISVPDATNWSPTVKWDFWYNGVVKDILNKENGKLIPENIVWSEKDGKWATRDRLNAGRSRSFEPQPYYGETAEVSKYISTSESISRVDEPYDPSPGGGTKYTIPSITYNEILALHDRSYKYKYVFGLKYVKAKLSNYAQRGVYVSKPISSLGDVSEVKLKASSINFIESNTLESLTSVEYSVTNNPDISNESSWRPILPIENAMITAERLFPDSSGLARFRFNASGDSISLYKNGIPYSQSDLSSFYVRRENTNTIYGLKIPLSKYSSSDILTCDYAPDVSSSIVSFDNYANQVNSYLSYYGQNGPGQSFSGVGQLEYQLEYSPYIDYSQVSSSEYSSEIGLNPYTPINIVFDDGTYARNLTNYKTKAKVSLNATSEGYYFLQSNNIIIFNKPVSKNFRVFYNYLPNTFRFRVVLRSNYIDSISPKVDFYQIKAKTRKPDSQRY